MSPFWQGFMNVFGRKFDSNLYTKYKPKEFNWYEPVSHLSKHSFWDNITKRK